MIFKARNLSTGILDALEERMTELNGASKWGELSIKRQLWVTDQYIKACQSFINLFLKLK